MAVMKHDSVEIKPDRSLSSSSTLNLNALGIFKLRSKFVEHPFCYAVGRHDSRTPIKSCQKVER